MKYFVYCRKSSDREDRQILSPEAQKRLLLEHAQRNRLHVVDVYVEHQTAYKTARPLFNEMLARLEEGEADAILAYHLTRLARNSYDGGRLIYMMDEETVVQIATPEKVYVNTGDDKFMMQIHFAMAKKSSDDTSQFVRRDVESKLLRGEYPGMVPPGYLNISRDGHITKGRDSTEKYLLLLKLGRSLRREEIDPIDGQIVRLLFREAATGTRSLLALRKFSCQMGLRSRSGEMLSRNASENMLTNPYYYGAIEYNGVLYDDAYLQERSGNPLARVQHTPLIPKALFDEVQARVFGRRRGPYRRHAFAFGSCVMTCGDCGCPVTAERQKGHVYYHCTHRRGPCSQTTWTREEVIEEQFTDLLAGLRVPLAFLDYAFAKVRKCHAVEAQWAAALRRKLQGRLNDCQQKLTALLQLKISPGNARGELLSDDEYLAQKRALKEEIEGLEQQLASAGQQDGTWVEDCESFFRFTQDLATAFRRASVERKKEVLALICSNLTLTGHVLAPVYREPYASLARFPLAGREADFPSEPGKVASVSEKPEIIESWLDVLHAIRTMKILRPWEWNVAYGSQEGRKMAAQK